MNDRDPIVDLFERKLKNAEFDVDPSVWTNIASQIPATSTSAVGGLSLTSKLLITASAVATIAVTSVSIYLYSNTKEEPNRINPAAVEQNLLEDQDSEKTEDIVIPRSLENTVESELNTSKEEETSIQESVVLDEVNDVLTINTIDQIIEQDQLVQEDQLIDEFILIKEEDQVKEENTESNNSEEEVGMDEIQEETTESLEVIIPNVFTPNNDGQNDLYYVTFDGVINNVSVVIFNHTGEVVYKSSQADFKWDGRNMFGDTCPTGKYIFMMTGEDQNGKEVLKNKDFQLLR